MKSIREWRSEKESNNFYEANLVNSLRNMVGGSSVKADASIKAGLRSRIISLWKDAKGNGMGAKEFLNQVWAVVGSLVTGRSGDNVSVGAVGRSLASEPQHAEWMALGDAILSEEDMTQSQFTRVMGGSTVDVDPEIKSKLRDKIRAIQNDEDFRDKDPETLLREIMAVVSSLLAGKSGSSMSTSGVFGKLHNSSEEKVANVG
jgi:hypothetical protein